MRYIVFTIATLMGAFLMLSVAFAQSDNSQLDQARAELQAGRDQIIREDLQLGEEELAAFWPIYEQYVADLSPIRDRKGTLVKQFMQAYRSGEFSAEFAEWLIEENFSIKEAWTEVQRAYVDRFLGVLSPQAVARFYQLENKLDAEVDAQLALIVPLVE